MGGFVRGSLRAAPGSASLSPLLPCCCSWVGWGEFSDATAELPLPLPLLLPLLPLLLLLRRRRRRRRRWLLRRRLLLRESATRKSPNLNRSMPPAVEHARGDVAVGERYAELVALKRQQ